MADDDAGTEQKLQLHMSQTGHSLNIHSTRPEFRDVQLKTKTA